MPTDASQNSDKEYNLRDLFDEILGRHLERLIGTRHGIDALPLNSINISCLIMLVERENEIDSAPSSLSERYTVKTISRELEEIGFDISEKMNPIVLEMIQKNYIKVDNNRLTPRKPAISMCQLLDKVFPEMPGMSLVAYFVQTTDEVHSGRKDLKSAINQLDQTLQMQGVSLKKETSQPQRKIDPGPSPEPATHSFAAEAPRKGAPPATHKKVIKTSEILTHPKLENRSKDIPDASSGPKILSSGYYTDKTEIRELNFGRPAPAEDDPTETAPATYAEIEPEEPQLHDQETEVVDGQSLPEKEVSEDTPSEEVDTGQQGALTGLESAAQETDLDESVDPVKSENTASLDNEALIVLEEEEIEAAADAAVKEEVLDGEDDLIERRIAAFEDDLAMECPLCKKSRVEAEKTARGKSYYKCSDKTCNFISWGIPHHILCPQCNNPFLIESNKAGKTILKCPRATCRHWQEPPWETADSPPERIDSASPKSEKVAAVTRKPRRRVKKRRVVRRKK